MRILLILAFPELLVMYGDDAVAVALQEYGPTSFMTRGLKVSVEVNGDL